MYKHTHTNPIRNNIKNDSVLIYYFLTKKIKLRKEEKEERQLKNSK